jgi:hypothetical protein
LLLRPLSSAVRRLDEEGADVPQQRLVQTNALVHRPTQLGCADTLSGSGDLNIRVMGTAIGAQHDRQTAHAFPADDADLDAAFASVSDEDAKPPSMK